MLARIRAGGNPADDIRKEKETPTLREFADEYLRRCEPHWKPSGRRTVRIYLKARILPAFGRMPLDRIGPEDVAAWFDAASRDKPGPANRALEILRSMMFRAEEWGMCERDTNPCIGIRKNPRRDIARFLDANELARLGRLLAGFALTHSVGAGAAHDAEWRYAMGSTVTTVLPYARLRLSDRLSAWGLAGTGTGSLTLDLDGGVSQHYRTDLSMTLAATGVRGL
ncbi:MAG: N-terminal phage integrase SAM-like domain-containing protein, partial [Rhodospirillales bacterium]|nr:N-terminal phage integrase SAM-like domain-containing protein [Rhodospirillales bacterium]